MSKEQAVAFFEEISKNTQLAQKVEKVVGGKGSDEAKAKELISLAQRYNFNFTPEEAASAQGLLKKPLSPEEMLEVSAGKLNLKSSLMALTLLAGLGVGGAAMPGMEASAMKRTNYSSSSRSSGKRGKTDGQTLENLKVNSKTRPQTEVGTQQQTLPQLAGATTPEQGETSPGEQEAQTRGTPQEKKVRKNVEHDKKAAERYSGVDGCGKAQVEWARRVSASGALPAADWPAAPPAWFWRETTICRFCSKKLEARGKKELDVKCANAGCIYNWVFPPTGDAKLKGNQRGRNDKGHYVRWALLPALILDSRLPTVGRGSRQRPRPAAIITPAEAWAVWQLIVGHNNGWADVRTMMAAHNVDPTIQKKVVRLLKESYDNLVRGNESFIDLGREVQQLVAGYNNGWLDILDAMDQCGYDASTVNTAIARMEHAYNMLTDEQLNAVGIDRAKVVRNPASTFDEILKKLTPRLEAARRQREAEKEAARQQAEAARQQEEARRQAKKVTVRQVIEALQRGEELSIEEARAIAPMLTCGKCGKTGVSARQIGERVYFQCANKKCRKGISKKPAKLLAMLQEAAPENVPMGMVPIEPNKPQMQLEIQPMQMTPGDGPTFALNFNSSTRPQIGMQGMNQFNPGPQMMTPQDMVAMEMDDDGDYEYKFDMDGYNDFDEDDDFDVPFNRKPKEVKERREDYENQEPYIPEPGMMGYQAPQQPMQMMSQNGFGFYFGGQDVNQFYTVQPMQQTFAPNLFNANKEQSFNIQRIPVFQMPTNQNDTQQQNEQIDPLNMNQIHITDPAQPIDQLLEEDQLINDDQNDLVMQQNTQVYQDQQPMNDRPGLNFDPTQVLQQLAAQQNVTQPPQNPNENGFTWQFDAENNEETKPGLWNTWGQ